MIMFLVMCCWNIQFLWLTMKIPKGDYDRALNNVSSKFTIPALQKLPPPGDYLKFQQYSALYTKAVRNASELIRCLMSGSPERVQLDQTSLYKVNGNHPPAVSPQH